MAIVAPQVGVVAVDLRGVLRLRIQAEEQLNESFLFADVQGN